MVSDDYDEVGYDDYDDDEDYANHLKVLTRFVVLW